MKVKAREKLLAGSEFPIVGSYVDKRLKWFAMPSSNHGA
jgi:hypothetical protein